VLARLGSRRLKAANEPVAVAQAMATLLAGRPADQIAAFLEASLERAGPETGNWDTRAALLWVLVADAMLKIPTRHPPAATVREIREFFRDDHVHPALIVSPAGHLVRCPRFSGQGSNRILAGKDGESVEGKVLHSGI
jgi:hypothetical protein